MGRPRTDIRPRLIRSARECFARQGVDGCSLREIARGAGTSIGMVYYYFPTKDDLFYAVVEDVYSNLLTDLAQVLAAEGGVEERILRLYRRMGQVSDLELLTLRLIVQELLGSPARRAKLIERFQRGHIAMVLGALFDGVKQGDLRGDISPPVLLFGTMALGSIPQLVLRALSTQGNSPFGRHPQGEALAEQLLGMLINGIGTTRGARTPPRQARES